MAAETFVFNRAKGRVAQLYKNVDDNTPSGCALWLVPLSQSGSQAQGQDLDTMAAVEADANFAEQTGGGWVRKKLVDAQLAEDPGPEDTGNTYTVALPSVTWTAPTAGSNVTGLLVCYDNTGSDADSALIPITHHVFAVTADGNDVVLTAGNFFVAS